MGTVGGFKLYVEDRAGVGFEELYSQVQGAIGEGYTKPSLAGLFSSFQVSVPQIDAHVDRERAKTYGVPLTEVFDTLQVYLGSLYANDLTASGAPTRSTCRPNPGSASGQNRSACSGRGTRTARWCRWDRSSASGRATAPSR